MSDTERAIGRLEGKMDLALERLAAVETKVDALSKKDTAHEIRWAKLGAYAFVAGLIGSALFKIGIAIAS